MATNVKYNFYHTTDYPESPSQGDIWFNPGTGIISVYAGNDVWETYGGASALAACTPELQIVEEGGEQALVLAAIRDVHSEDTHYEITNRAKFPIANNESAGLMTSSMFKKLNSMSQVLRIVHVDVKSPNQNSKNYNSGDVWINTDNNTEWVFVGEPNTGVWVELGPTHDTLGTVWKEF